MYVTKVISTSFDSFKRRAAQVLRFGKSDAVTALEANAYGVDSNPVKDMIAIYAQTELNGKPVILGYVNKNQQANVGELRIYSTDASGNQKTYIWLTNTGIIQLGGTADYAVRYGALQTAFNQLKNDFNALVNVFNSHVHAGTFAVSGSSATGTVLATVTPGSGSSADIAPAKISTIQTP
jgi:hypothetical protein